MRHSPLRKGPRKSYLNPFFSICFKHPPLWTFCFLLIYFFTYTPNFFVFAIFAQTTSF